MEKAEEIGAIESTKVSESDSDHTGPRKQDVVPRKAYWPVGSVLDEIADDKS